MNLLDQLWDDTLAGPRPEKGLGKLRKHPTFSFSPSFRMESYGGDVGSCDGDASEEPVKVTRSIMIIKSPRTENSDSPPATPAEATPPASPSSGKEAFQFRRRSRWDAYERASGIGPRNPPPPYDL